MKKLLSISAILFLFAVLAAPLNILQADLIIEGKKPVSPCVTIENQDEYPDHVFVLRAYGVNPESSVIEVGDCVYWYKFNQSVTIFAIDKDVYDESLFQDGSSPSTMDGVERQGIDTSEYEEVDENDKLDGRRDIFKVDALMPGYFSLTKVRTEEITTDTNGEAGDKSDEDNTMLYAAVAGAISLVAVAGFIVIKKK